MKKKAAKAVNVYPPMEKVASTEMNVWITHVVRVFNVPIAIRLNNTLVFANPDIPETITNFCINSQLFPEYPD